MLWSGIFDHALLWAFGVCSVGVCVWFTKRMHDAIEDDGLQLEWTLGWKLIPYSGWLLLEIIKSNLYVAKLILSPSMRISPRVIRVKAGQKSEMGQVLYANSITLTPGTITLDLRDGKILVHALTQETAAGVLTGDMDRRCTAVENSPGELR